MKKLFVGMLVLGSASCFADYCECTLKSYAGGQGYAYAKACLNIYDNLGEEIGSHGCTTVTSGILGNHGEVRTLERKATRSCKKDLKSLIKRGVCN